MARKPSGRTGLILLLVILLVTILISPFGFVYRFKMYCLAMCSLGLEQAGFYEDQVSENERLRENNKRLAVLLKQKETEVFLLNEELRQYRRLQALPAAEGGAIAARVIMYDPAAARSRIVLNRGSDHGAAEGAVVLEGDYLAGKVIGVTPETCEVLLVNDSQLVFSVRVGTQGLVAVLKGRGKGQSLDVSFIDNQPENTVSRGDLVITTGFAPGVPAGIPIGEVHNDPEVSTAEYQPYKIIRVKPFVNLLALKTVFILPLAAAAAAEAVLSEGSP